MPSHSLVLQHPPAQGRVLHEAHKPDQLGGLLRPKKIIAMLQACRRTAEHAETKGFAKGDEAPYGAQKMKFGWPWTRKLGNRSPTLDRLHQAPL
mmetsp:Transcript_16563/g.32391  ORF Transcript_16563/g.32391 Transcript_16563/m.32391 type:complete len:94 (-) Transcript_16563:12-293(-)